MCRHLMAFVIRRFQGVWGRFELFVGASFRIKQHIAHKNGHCDTSKPIDQVGGWPSRLGAVIASFRSNMMAHTRGFGSKWTRVWMQHKMETDGNPEKSANVGVLAENYFFHIYFFLTDVSKKKSTTLVIQKDSGYFWWPSTTKVMNHEYQLVLYYGGISPY